MKKFFGLFFVLICTVIFTAFSFADTENMPSANAPGMGKTVTSAEYTPTPTPTSQTVTINDGNSPASGNLVKTGGIPASFFYGAGGLCIVAALIIPKRKTKESNK